MQTFVYVWHIESLDTFDAHFSNYSRFLNMVETDWITGITLIYWSIEPLSDTDPDATAASDSHPPDPFDEGRRKARFSPKTFRAKKFFFRGKKQKQDTDTSQKSYTVQENATSLVISTNPFGEFGKCTLISKIVPEWTYWKVSGQVIYLWAAFAYLPSVARCLIFLAFLGPCVMACRKNIIKFFVI
jgi:hypothetical protein